MGSRIRSGRSNLFEVFVEVQRGDVLKDDDGSNAAKVTFSYPAANLDEDLRSKLPIFAFPFRDNFQNTAVDQFAFTLIEFDGSYKFCFCRLAPSCKTCLCIVSYKPWFEIFHKLLNYLAEVLSRTEDNDITSLLNSLLTIQCSANEPRRKFNASNTSRSQVFEFVTPDLSLLPSIPDNRNLFEYYSAIDTYKMMVIFASMLRERRILVTSKKLSKLSACLFAAESLVYPMHWQHIFIPVLPPQVIDTCSAPMPYLIGIHSSLLPEAQMQEIDEVILLDADNNTVVCPVAFNDVMELPADVLGPLKKQLKVHLKAKTSDPCVLQGETVSRAFLQAVVNLIGGYRDAVRGVRGSLEFDEETFVTSRSTGVQPYLEQLLHLQCFEQFIKDRVDALNKGVSLDDVFETEAELVRNVWAQRKKDKQHRHKQFKNLESDLIQLKHSKFGKKLKQEGSEIASKMMKSSKKTVQEMKILMENTSPKNEDVPVNRRRAGSLPMGPSHAVAMTAVGALGTQNSRVGEETLGRVPSINENEEDHNDYSRTLRNKESTNQKSPTNKGENPELRRSRRSSSKTHDDSFMLLERESMGGLFSDQELMQMMKSSSLENMTEERGRKGELSETLRRSRALILNIRADDSNSQSSDSEGADRHLLSVRRSAADDAISQESDVSIRSDDTHNDSSSHYDSLPDRGLFPKSLTRSVDDVWESQAQSPSMRQGLRRSGQANSFSDGSKSLSSSPLVRSDGFRFSTKSGASSAMAASRGDAKKSVILRKRSVNFHSVRAMVSLIETNEGTATTVGGAVRRREPQLSDNLRSDLQVTVRADVRLKAAKYAEMDAKAKAADYKTSREKLAALKEDTGGRYVYNRGMGGYKTSGELLVSLPRRSPVNSVTSDFSVRPGSAGSVNLKTNPPHVRHEYNSSLHGGSVRGRYGFDKQSVSSNDIRKLDGSDANTNTSKYEFDKQSASSNDIRKQDVDSANNVSSVYVTPVNTRKETAIVKEKPGESELENRVRTSGGLFGTSSLEKHKSDDSFTTNDKRISYVGEISRDMLLHGSRARSGMPRLDKIKGGVLSDQLSTVSVSNAVSGKEYSPNNVDSRLDESDAFNTSAYTDTSDSNFSARDVESVEKLITNHDDTENSSIFSQTGAFNQVEAESGSAIDYPVDDGLKNPSDMIREKETSELVNPAEYSKNSLNIIRHKEAEKNSATDFSIEEGVRNSHAHILRKGPAYFSASERLSEQGSLDRESYRPFSEISLYDKMVDACSDWPINADQSMGSNSSTSLDDYQSATSSPGTELN